MKYTRFLSELDILIKNDINSPVVVLINEDNGQLKSVIKKLESCSRLFYVYIFGKGNHRLESENNVIYISSPKSLYMSLVLNYTNYGSFEDYLNSLNLKKFPYDFKNEYFPFGPIRNNYFHINQVALDFSSGNENNLMTYKELEAISRSIIMNPEQHDRQRTQIESLELFDKLVSGIFNHYDIQFDNLENINPPIIISFPYHSPILKNEMEKIDQKVLEHFKVNYKQFVRILQVEQDRNYLIHYQGTDQVMDKIKDVVFESVSELQNRIYYLDLASFLHASILYSPTMRLPVIGSSINREASFVKPSNFGRLSQFKNRKRIKNTIYSLGHKIVSEKLRKTTIKYLSDRQSQVVSISDAPIEWMVFDDIPFCFTHDICRIPESPISSVNSQYNSNLVNQLVLNKTTLDFGKILIVYGTTEDAFKEWQDVVEKLSELLGFTTVAPNTIQELASIIDSVKPTMIIFDCHGGFNQATYSTYLEIGSEKLTNEKVIEYSISAPIIYLSACGTAPNYGFVNTIAQGFFESGALSVTSTFLPIDVNSGSINYINLLQDIGMALESGIFKNLLEFLRFTDRKTFLDSVLERFKRSSTSSEYSRIEGYFNDLKKKLFSVRERHELFKEIYNSKVEGLSKILEEVIPEYLFYTHLGRSDLLYFESWLVYNDKMAQEIFKYNSPNNKG